MSEREGPRAAEYSFWLLPDPVQEASFAAEIASLAPDFEQPAFQAHATIHGDLTLAPEVLLDFLPEIAAGIDPLAWRVESALTSPQRFRSLFLLFERTDDFSLLQERTQKLCCTRVGLSPFPHLSLAYGEARAGRDKLAEAARLSASYAGERIVFSRLALAASSSALPVEAWRVIRTIKLGVEDR